MARVYTILHKYKLDNKKQSGVTVRETILNILRVYIHVRKSSKTSGMCT